MIMTRFDYALVGKDLNNFFLGVLGDDTLDGGLGIDTVGYHSGPGRSR